MKIFSKINIALIILFAISFSLISLPAKASLADDADAYEKFPLYEKYEKKQNYDKYKKLQKIKKQLGFSDPKVKAAAKQGYNNYRLYKKTPAKYRSFAQFLPQYNLYKKYAKYSDYGKYKKYSKYDDDKYDHYEKYGSAEYEAGYNRYKAFINDIGNVTSNRGPEIKVGLWSYSKDDIAAGSPFVLSANKTFNVNNCAGTLFGQIAVGATANTTYIAGSGGHLTVADNLGTVLSADAGDRICFEATDGNNDDMIFDTNRPSSTFDHYRGKIKIQHSYTADNQTQEGDMRRIWVINMLPLEHYVWGFGEIGGGVEQHSLAMIVTARTYARWYLQPTVTKWNEEGFNVLSTSSSQIYRGYDYEKDHPTIPDLARRTNGIIMRNQDGDIVLAAYGSWTDGRTRKYEDGLFGGSCKSPTAGDASAIYPELSAVDDPYGKNQSLDTCALASAGNHMVGLSANGSLNLAANYGWTWTHILSYYYSRISIVKEY
jgi:hypothetical protein